MLGAMFAGQSCGPIDEVAQETQRKNLNFLTNGRLLFLDILVRRGNET